MPSLLDLPRELTDQIYGYLLGYQFVEIRHDMSDRWGYNYLIRRPLSVARRLSTAEKYEAVQIPQPGQIELPVAEAPYDNTKISSPIWELYPDNQFQDRPRPRAMEHAELHVNILKVCKRTNKGATEILWGTNVFYLGSIHMLDTTLNDLGHQAFSQIRHIHVEDFGIAGLQKFVPNFIRDKNHKDHTGYFRDDTGPLVREWMAKFQQLKALRTIHLTIDTPQKRDDNQSQIIFLLLLKTIIWTNV